MKIVIMSIGTRGDMEPFLAIGELLKQRGHDVICAFPEQFKNLAQDSNLEFASLGSKFIEMIESDVGKAVMGGGGFLLTKMGAYWKIIRIQGGINEELVKKQFEIISRENPDRIVHHGKALYPVMWELENQGKTIFVSPRNSAIRSYKGR